MLKTAVAMTVLSLTFGCSSHPRVIITVPSKAASTEKRTEAYESFHGVSKHGLRVPRSRQKDHLELADGRKVYDPGDLYHAVPRDSEADYAMALHERYKSGSKAIRYLGISAAVVGAVVMGVGAATSDKDGRAGPLIVGGAAIAGGLAAVVVGGGFLDHKADVQRERVFASYNDDLAEKLGLCISTNGTPVECPDNKTNSPPAPTPTAQPAKEAPSEESSDGADSAEAPPAQESPEDTDAASEEDPEMPETEEPSAPKDGDPK